MSAAATAVDGLRERVQAASGWDLSGARGDLFVSALARAAVASQRSSEAQAETILAGGDRALAGFLAEVAVGETYFFRDPAQWAFVEETVIPGAVARRGPGGGTTFRAWSAGCASGEEPYSLAMLLADRGLLTRSRIVATDVSEVALSRARAAEYTHWSVRGGLDTRAQRWLRDEAGRLRVDPRIVAAVEVSPLNLATSSYPDPRRGISDLDLILCRNVLMYLRPEVVAGAAARLFESLAPGGWLLTSPSDPALHRHAPFEVHRGAFGVAYERAARARKVVAPAAGAAASSGRAPRSLRPAGARGPERPPPTRAGAAQRAVETAHAQPPAVAHKAPTDACPGCRVLVDSGRLGEALELIDAAIRKQPLAPELHLLHAIVMADLGELREAVAACRRAIFLSRGQPFLHFFLATVLLRVRDLAGASLALRTAETLARRLDPNEEIPWSEGITASELAAAARWHLDRLEGGVPASP